MPYDIKSPIKTSSRILKEFEEFISRGSVIDLAVGIIIGAAFGKIVNSLVNDIIMPPIGLLLHGISFKNLFFALDGKHYNTLIQAQQSGVPTINYGNFISVIIEAIIIAASVFALIKMINAFKRDSKISIAAAPSKTEILLGEIRDLLKEKSSTS